MQPELRARLEEVAKKNGRSMNAEITDRLEKSFTAIDILSPAPEHIESTLLFSFPPGEQTEALVEAIREYLSSPSKQLKINTTEEILKIKREKEKVRKKSIDD